MNLVLIAIVAIDIAILLHAFKVEMDERGKYR